MQYRQMFLIEAENEEQARLNYGNGEQSDYDHSEPEIIAVEVVEQEKGEEQLFLFAHD